MEKKVPIVPDTAHTKEEDLRLVIISDYYNDVVFRRVQSFDRPKLCTKFDPKLIFVHGGLHII